MRTPNRVVLVMVPLTAALMVSAFLPDGSWYRDVGFNLTGALSVTLAYVGLRLHRAGLPMMLVLVGFLGWVLGDVLFALQEGPLGIDAYPSPADAIYICSYGLVAWGLGRMTRSRGGRGEVAAILDAAILATGTAVVVGAFLLVPIAGDSTLSLPGKLTSCLYPIADVMLLGILARFWSTPGARTAAFRLLAAALSVTLVADTIAQFASLLGGNLASSALTDLMWASAYVMIAGAAWSPSVVELSEPLPGREDLTDPSKRLVVLTGGLLLPAVSLVVNGLTTENVVWPVTAAGSVLLSVLVVARMAGLLTVVQAQAVQLAALARSDPLTGAPNRRTWDHELSRACAAARGHGHPLVVAMVDLDHFKLYNDRFGHPAGDRLLREAVAAWSELLRGDEMLARYGGEEFSFIFPHHRPAEARERLQAMLERTPEGQTFSAGVALWDPESLPSAALAEADAAMYAAKRAGRGRICLAPGSSPSPARALRHPVP